ncbi:hypothetical protein [Streptomyces dysideae]|uniref:hypothetical protein n=1 Tax=Streptomyces dysideae TaxID=909626 RepID=UPI000B27FE4D|nr:hypothetical protein [Streptomyces dysideae]
MSKIMKVQALDPGIVAGLAPQPVEVSLTLRPADKSRSALVVVRTAAQQFTDGGSYGLLRAGWRSRQVSS